MRSNPMFPRRQGGAVLVVSMLLLLVMTALALTATQSTRMEERMAGNARDLDLAFQAGEAGARAGEQRIAKVVAPKRGLRLLCANPATCDAVDRREAQQDYAHQDQKWWDEQAYMLDTALTHVKDRPRFVLEEWANVPDTLTEGGSTQKSGTIYYNTTTRSLGATETTVSIIETTYAVRY